MEEGQEAGSSGGVKPALGAEAKPELNAEAKAELEAKAKPAAQPKVPSASKPTYGRGNGFSLWLVVAVVALALAAWQQRCIVLPARRPADFDT